MYPLTPILDTLDEVPTELVSYSAIITAWRWRCDRYETRDPPDPVDQLYGVSVVDLRQLRQLP